MWFGFTWFYWPQAWEYWPQYLDLSLSLSLTHPFIIPLTVAQDNGSNNGSDHKLSKKGSDHKLTKEGSDHKLSKKSSDSKLHHSHSSGNKLGVDDSGADLKRVASATSMRVSNRLRLVSPSIQQPSLKWRAESRDWEQNIQKSDRLRHVSPSIYT